MRVYDKVELGYFDALRKLVNGEVHKGLIVGDTKREAVEIITILLATGEFDDVVFVKSRMQLTYEGNSLVVVTLGGGEHKLIDDIQGCAFDYVAVCTYISNSTEIYINSRVKSKKFSGGV